MAYKKQWLGAEAVKSRIIVDDGPSTLLSGEYFFKSHNLKQAKICLVNIYNICNSTKKKKYV
jgi:hypothetical protein